MLRFLYLLVILSKYSCIFVLLKLGLYRKPKQKLLKHFFEDAGGSFIKFGQLLALRVDVLPQEYSLEMLDLLDNVQPFPSSQVTEIFLQELGATPEKIFYDFQKEPFASGSFGQVHAAKIDKKTIVAVKIMRPEIEEMVKADFLVLDTLTFIADLFYHIPGLAWKEFSAEFKRWTLQELDYHTEAEHAERLRNSLEKGDPVVVPLVYERYSTKRILVQEYIDGVHLSRVLRGLKDGRLTLEKLLAMGIDLKKMASVLTQTIMKQYFVYGFFHADLHPGNIILLPENRLALIDFGIMGEALEANQEAFIKFIKASGEFNFKEATFYFASIAGEDLKQMIQSAFPASIEQKEIDEFMHILTDHFSSVIEELVQENKTALNAKKTDYTVLLMKMLSAAESYKIHLPREFVIFIKTLSTLGLLCKEMDFDYRIYKEIKYFFTKYPEKELIPLIPSKLPYRRISRERALEQLNNWLAYLFEKDPAIYKLVNTYISQYNKVDR